MTASPREDRAASAREDIAVIGMAGRFPGARTVDELWRNLRDGVESVRSFTRAELASCGVDPSVLDDPGYVNAGAVLDDAEWFASSFFGYAPREAELMDPQQRVFLECAWEALERAGYDPERCPGTVSVYAGVALNTYFQNNLIGHPALTPLLGQFQLTLGNEKDFVATRLAHKLNFRGAALTVQSGCSTSLVATHLACQALLSGECDVAVVGGGRIRVPLHAGYHYIEGGVPSPDGHCRAFDADAQGCIAGSGMAVVVLKRLSDAQRDGDLIHAVLRGSAINNDGGNKTGFTAPSVEGQSAAILQALAMADVDAASIGYVEAHGTGTSLGDPIEVAALTRAYRQHTDRRGYCRIGSVKTNIGHLDAGAGVAGLIKAVLAVKHGEIPPSLNFRSPNPQIDFDNSPFVVATRLEPWSDANGPRRAGVSSFGIGGTNAHVIVEQPPAVTNSTGSRAAQALVLSAKSPAALDQASANLADALRRGPDRDLGDVAYTLQTGRSALAYRRMIVSRTSAGAADLLESRDPVSVISGTARLDDPPIAFLFPGGGAQYPRMGLELYETEAVYRQAIDRCLHHSPSGSAIRALMFPGDAQLVDAARELERPSRSLPALFATEFAVAEQLKAFGIRPAAMLGHSMGEYVAACLAGVFTPEEGMALVTKRGELFETLPDGGMLSVPLPADELGALLGPELSIGAVNGPALCMASGPARAIDDLEARLISRGVECTRIHIPVAAHSAMLDAVLGEFERFCRTIALRKPSIPFVSNLTGTWITAEQATDPAYWVRHLRSTVQFGAGMDTLLETPERVFLEVGPGRTLAGLARQQTVKTPYAFTTLRHPKEAASDVDVFLQAIGRLWVSGVTIDWPALHVPASRRRVILPTYPFERKRHWIDPVGVQRPVAPSLDVQGAAAPALPSEAHEDQAAPAAGSRDSGSRRDRLVTELKTLLNGMSGVDVSQLDEHATFLALGFDSLFLTQVTQALRRQYGVKITFRQLMEELRNIASVAARLDGILPHDARQPAPEPAQPAEQSSAVPLTPKQQPYNPYEPLAKGGDASLTPEQRAHLDALTARYAKRSARSKEITQQYRQVLADPRSVAGFRSTWKEIIYPTVSTRSSGAYIWDADGHRYIDLMMGYGVNLFGHSPEFVTSAVRAQLERGIELGPQSELAGRIAELVTELTGAERVTFCNTGSEAVLAAIRVARTVTGRPKIAIFAGSYHGLFDEVLTKSILVGGREQSVPVAPGIPRHMSQNVIVLPYGDPSALDTIRAHAGDLAAVLVEPVQSRRPDLQPAAFLRQLRDVTTQTDVPLIFDEMITGFRIHQGGAQAWFDVRADLVTYGKIVGGGLPLAMVAGKAAFMDAFDGGTWQYGDDSAPEANLTYFAGTYVRHPLALASSLAVLEHLKQAGPALQQRLNDRASQLVARLNAILTARALPMTMLQCGSLFRFQMDPDLTHANLLFFHLRENGIDAWPRFNFFLSTAHSDADLDEVVGAVDRSLDQMQAGGFLPRSTVAVTVPATAPAPAVPLTEAQLEVWLACRFGHESSLVFNEGGTIRFDGAIDEGALARAWRAVVDRHEALRTTFAPDASAQQVTGSAVVGLELVDFSALDPAEQTAGRDAILRIESETPFDLEHGPLVRAKLLRYDPDTHELVLIAHHLVCDGTSFGTIVRDLAALYTEYAGGKPADLAPATPFSAFAAWQAEQARHPDDAKNESYWKQQFADEPPILQLPTDRPRSTATTFTSAVETLVVSKSTLESLKRVSGKRGCTLFGTLLTAFYVLLHRLSGQDDTVIGISTSGQNLMGRDGLVGHCVNFLPIRLHASPTLDEQLHAVRDVLLDALDHQNYTFGRLVRSLTLGRHSGRMPLLSAIFNMDPKAEPLLFGDVRTFERGVPKRFANVDLFLNAVQVDEGLRLDCTYLTGLYDADTIRRWLGHYECLLLALLEDVRTPIAEVALMRDAERRRLLEQFSGPRAPQVQGHVPVDGDATLASLFEAQVARTPDAVAITAPGQTLSYRQLNAQANRVAHQLRALGVEPNALVGLFVERSPALIAGLIGILKAGGAYLPIDVASPAERLAFMLEDGRAGIVLSERSLVEKLPRTAARVICIEDVVAFTTVPQQERNPEVRAGADDLAYVIYTSGTTGQPKGSEITHRNVVRLFAAADVLYGFHERDVWTLFHSHAFDFSVWEIWGALLYGGRLVVVPFMVSRSADAFYDLVADERVTVLNQTPSAFRHFIQADATHQRRLALRYVIFGGEALEPQMLRPWFERHGDAEPKLVNMYGITETTVHVTHHQLSSADLTAGSVIGVPIPGWTVHLLDEGQQPVPVGVIGEIYVGGAGVSRGYHRRDELTHDRFVPDPFAATPGARLYRSGDLARYRATGELEYIGRRDQQLKIRGFRVELGEIEARLAQHAAVGQCAVIAREDAQGDRTLTAYVVPAASAVVEPASLRAHLKNTLPDYMIPAAYVRMDSLPLTLNGKLDTQALPRPSRDHLTLASAFVAPRMKTEQSLAAMWREMLGLSQVGAQDDFFLLGGHSLLAMRLLDRVHQEIGVSLPPGVFFGHSKLADMARQVDEAAERASRPPKPRLVSIASGGSGTPFFWVHGVGGEVVSYRRISEHLAAARPVFGFQPDWDQTTAEEASVEAMAGRYVKELRAAQPSGPYHLGGFCSAALLALEIARQLEAGGEKVGLLAALDYVIKPTPRSFANPADLLAFGANVPRWLAEDAVVSGAREVMGRIGSKLRKLARGLTPAAAGAETRVADVRDELGMWRFPDHSVAMLTAHYTAFKQYEARPFNGRVTLILPRTSPLLGPWRRAKDGDWDGIATGGVDTHRVRGSHFTMLIDPFAAELASLLNARIDEAERETPRPYRLPMASVRTIDMQAQPVRTAAAGPHRT